MSDNTEKRFFDGLEVRMAEDDKRTIEGYGIVFDKRFHLYGRYHEEIDKKAGEYFRDYKEKDKRDCISAYNHNFEKILGRTAADTLRFEVDEKGVRYIVDVPNTSYGDDLLESISRGDIRGSSFVFSVKSEEFIEEDENTIVRRITAFKRVVEMGPVVNPAYTDTTVAKRSFDEYEQQQETPEETPDEQNKEDDSKAVRRNYKSRIRAAQILNKL